MKKLNLKSAMLMGAIGAIAGSILCADKNAMAQGAAFFGLVGVGLGYGLQDFSLKTNRLNAFILLAAFFAPILGLLYYTGFHALMQAGIVAIATITVAFGMLAMLIVYAMLHVMDLIEETRSWPAGNSIEDDFFDDDLSLSLWGYGGSVMGYGYNIGGFRTSDDD